MFKKFVAVSAVGLVAVLGLSACAPTASPVVTSHEMNHSSQGSLSHSDVMFVEGMVAHHEQALEMAQIVLHGSDNVAVQRLANKIIDAQSNEISMLESWVNNSGMQGMSMGDMGMVSESDVQALKGLKGVVLDDAFLRLMIAHHEGAVSMCEDVLKSSQSGKIREYAQSVVDGQGAEIEYMKGLISKQ